MTSRVHFWSKNWNFQFSTKNWFEASKQHFKANFDRIILTFDFLTKNRFLTSRVHFWSKNRNFHFLTKNRFETSRHHFWANFGRKIQILIFWPKIDFWRPGTIFGQKIEIFIFWPKIDLRPLGTIFGQILVEKLKFRFFDQKSIFDLQGPF